MKECTLKHIGIPTRIDGTFVNPAILCSLGWSSRSRDLGVLRPNAALRGCAELQEVFVERNVGWHLWAP